MSDTSYTSESATYSRNTLTAFFDNRDDAEDAVSRLREIGVSDTAIRLAGGASTDTTADPYREKGFWDGVVDFFMPDEDRSTYAEGLRRGGYIVTVSGLSESQYDQTLDILDDEGSVDIDERATSWRTEGWTGSDTSMGSDRLTGSDAVMGSDSVTASDRMTSSSTMGSTDYVGGTSALGVSGDADMTDRSMTSATDSSISGRTSDRVGDDEVIPVVRENLRIGKRDVNLGRVRVRSYMVEEPVSEEVRLRQEHVHVERRPVDRELTGNETAFTDRTIEAEEYSEEAVVSKEARVTEEISLRRDAEERTETVSDTVRHTEVEVEDDRSETSKDRTINKI